MIDEDLALENKILSILEHGQNHTVQTLSLKIDLPWNIVVNILTSLLEQKRIYTKNYIIHLNREVYDKSKKL